MLLNHGWHNALFQKLMCKCHFLFSDDIVICFYHFRQDDAIFKFPLCIVYNVHSKRNYTKLISALFDFVDYYLLKIEHLCYTSISKWYTTVNSPFLVWSISLGYTIKRPLCPLKPRQAKLHATQKFTFHSSHIHPWTHSLPFCWEYCTLETCTYNIMSLEI